MQRESQLSFAQSRAPIYVGKQGGFINCLASDFHMFDKTGNATFNRGHSTAFSIFQSGSSCNVICESAEFLHLDFLQFERMKSYYSMNEWEMQNVRKKMKNGIPI